jgi:hypothetical protein
MCVKCVVLQLQIAALQAEVEALKNEVSRLRGIIERLMAILRAIADFCQVTQRDADMIMAQHCPRGTWSLARGRAEVAAAVVKFLRG